MRRPLGKPSKLKNEEIWETVQIGGGGRQKVKKVPTFRWEKFKIREGVFGNQKGEIDLKQLEDKWMCNLGALFQGGLNTRNEVVNNRRRNYGGS